MRVKLYLFFSLLAFFSGHLNAHQIKLDAQFPAVSVLDDGELLIEKGKVFYQHWQSANLIGKVRIVHHLAGRSSVKEKNQPLIEAIKLAKFDPNRYQTTTIINADDAIFATGAFVKSSAEKGKIENPHSQVILDQKGEVKKAWHLKEKESFIAVLDKQGRVKFSYEGKLNQTQIEKVISLVTDLIKQ